MTSFKKYLITALTAVLLTSVAEAKTLRWGSSGDIYSLDPVSVGNTTNLAFLNHVYEGLIRYGPNFEIEPALATEWELIDGKFWRFKLREGVKFHNGDEMTADDVVASLNRNAHEKSPLRGNIPLYVGIKKVNDYTVDIEVSAPVSLFLNDMTNIYIFSEKWLKNNNTEEPTDAATGKEGYATHNTNGTGPFKLESRTPDTKTVLTVYNDWWDKKQHNLSRIEYIPISSHATRVAAMLSGEIDLIDAAPIQDLPRLSSSSNVRVEQGPGLRVVFLGFNMRDKLEDGRDNPFKDIRVRQAFETSIDRDLINQKVMRNLARPTGSLIAPDISGYSAELDTYSGSDPKRARELLIDAGQENLQFSYLCMNDEAVNEEDLCGGITNMLKRSGFNPIIDLGPRAVQRPKRTGGKADVFNLTWANEPTLDAYSLLSQILVSKNGSFGVSNHGSISYPEIDRLVEQAAQEENTEKRLVLEGEALRIAKDEALLIPIHQQPIAWALLDTVKDVDFRADGKSRHWRTRMAE